MGTCPFQLEDPALKMPRLSSSVGAKAATPVAGTALRCPHFNVVNLNLKMAGTLASVRVSPRLVPGPLRVHDSLTLRHERSPASASTGVFMGNLGVAQAGRLGVGFYYAHIAGYLALSERAAMELAVCVSLSDSVSVCRTLPDLPEVLIASWPMQVQGCCVNNGTVLYSTVGKFEQ